MKQITWQFYVQSAYASLKFFSQALSSAMLRHILLILANNGTFYIRFIYFEKATKLWEIPTLDLSYVVPVKFTVEILQNVVAFSKYMNFTTFHRNKFSGLQSIFLNNIQKCFSLYIWFQTLVGGKQFIHQSQLGNLYLFYMLNFERIDRTIRIERIKCVSEISDDFFISAIKRTPKLWLYTYNVQLVVLQ